MKRWEEILVEALEHNPHDRILHVGGHTGEEAQLYNQYCVGHVTWVEPLPLHVRQLRVTLDKHQRQHDDIIEAAAWDKNETRTFYQYANGTGPHAGGYSSLLQRRSQSGNPNLDKTKEQKHEVTCRTLDALLPTQTFDMVVMDTQGTEDRVIRGAEKLLRRCKALMVEVLLVSQYQDDALFPDICAITRPLGYRLRWYTCHTRKGQTLNGGDALFLKD